MVHADVGTSRYSRAINNNVDLAGRTCAAIAGLPLSRLAEPVRLDTKPASFRDAIEPPKDGSAEDVGTEDGLTSPPQAGPSVQHPADDTDASVQNSHSGLLSVTLPAAAKMPGYGNSNAHREHDDPLFHPSTKHT
jgi:hypothetical protein